MRIRGGFAVAVMVVSVVGGGLAVDVAGAAAAGAASTGSISTIAGNGNYGLSGNFGPATEASMEYPAGVAYDRAGNLYVANGNGNVVWKVSPSGIISAFAGTGVGGYSGDGGAATVAKIQDPHGVAVDAAGNVYIADTVNSRVRKVTPAGTISTFAGNGTSGSSGDGGPATLAALDAPAGIAVDPLGRVVVADAGANRVRRVATDGTISTIAGTGAAAFSGDGGPATFAALDGPFGVAFDANQNILVADNDNNRVRRIGAADGKISTIAGTGALSSTGDGGPSAAATLSGPYGVVADGAGDIFISEDTGARVRRIGTNGIIATVAGTGASGFNGDGRAATGATLYEPNFLAISPTSDLVVGDTVNNRVRSISGIASQGYAMAATDGGVFTHGSSIFYGSEGALKLKQPIVTMASTPTKQGYWLFAADGGVFTHGDAGYFGSEGALRLVQPIVAAASTPGGKGYWLFASDGGVFTHGDAGFYGSEGALKLVQPIVAGTSN